MTTAHDLATRLADLLRTERVARADFLLALASFDRDRRWADLGHSSLWYFLHRDLGLSAGAAQYRKTAAELVQRFPEIIEPLRDGRLCLTSIVEVARVLTAANAAEVLPRFFHISRREAKEVAVELHPRPAPGRAVVRQLVAPAAQLQPVEVDAVPEPARVAALQPVELDAAPSCPAPSPSRATAEPLTADLSRLHVTVSRAFLRKLEAAKAALSHTHPGAGAEAILEAGLDLVLAQHARRKGLVAKPRATKAKPAAATEATGAREAAPSQGERWMGRFRKGRPLRAG